MSSKPNRKAFLIASVLLLSALCTVAAARTIYVDDDATGANNGTSWTDAYTFLQDALSDAETTEKPVEIRVAQGVYSPNEGLVAIPEFDWRTATFQLINGVALKGGYGGLPASDPDARDFEQYETILSGDLDDDDVKVIDPCDLVDEPTRAENSYHVVTASGIDGTTVLDGLTITGGNANGLSPYERGAGMYNYNASPALSNCIFKENSAVNCGGGMYNEESHPTLNNCTFENNSAKGYTGSIRRVPGSGGGGMYNFWSNPTLITCNFNGNSAEGIMVWWMGGKKWQTNNYSCGGGIHNSDSDPVLSHCILTGNSAYYGGGLYSVSSNPTLTNCTFAQNSAQDGNALACQSLLSFSPSNLNLDNCILWDGGNEILNSDGSIINVTFSNMKGGFPGEGNTDFDPLFANPGYWANMNYLNIVVEPNNPIAVWLDGDYHLKSQAGRWDPNSESWVVDDVTSPCIDAGDPNSPVGEEPDPNGGIINMGAYGGTPQASKSYTEQIVTVQWLGHSTVKIWSEDYVVYVDPERVPQALHDADLVCVTHTHGDHYSPSDIAKVSNALTQFIAPPDVVQRYGSGRTIAPGQTINLDGVSVTAVPAYNTNKPNHPRSRNWVGFIIELDGRRIYVAGDTDLIEEMKTLGHIDVAFLPAGGTYTMNAVEAADATGYIKPDLAIPYHWGQNVGTLSDAQRFVELAQSPAMILSVNEAISSDNWPKYSPLVAHWKFDETEGAIAHDSVGGNDGTAHGEPIWRPAGGKVGGALELDGIGDYVSAGPVLNPANGPFSVFAWIKGGAPGQNVISQADAAGQIWLGTAPQSGALMTGLVPPPAGRTITQPLVSEFAITDGAWHHVGFTWDGSLRRLHVDGQEVAADAGAVPPLKSSGGGLNIGVGTDLDQGTFWAGLIDDVRVYRLTLSDEEIREIAG